MARRKKESAAPLKWEDVPEIPKEEQPYPLPEGWKWVRLGDITTMESGGTPSTKNEDYYTDGDIPWIYPSDLSSYKNIYISRGKRNISKPGLKNSSAKMLPTDSVCLTTRAPVGYVCIAENPLCTNQGFKNFLPSPLYHPHYLYWYLKGNKSFLETYASGTTFKEISGQRAKQILFPIPPLDTQQRIVTRIESLFSKLDEAAEKVQAVIDSHEARKQAILHQAFSGELTREWRKKNGVDFESWGEKSICDITNFIKAGGDKPEDFQENKDEYHFVPVIANGVENNGIIGYTSLSKHFENTLTIAGRGTIGFPFLRKYDYFPVVRLLVVSPKPSKILLKYLYYIFLAFPETGTGSSIPQLTVPKLKEKKIILCKIEEQKIIVNILDKVMEEESSLLEMGKSILERIDYLKKSILEKAFRGNLK